MGAPSKITYRMSGLEERDRASGQAMRGKRRHVSSRRREIQQQHERALVADFLGWLNSRLGTRFSVIEEPNPPEAIIRSARVTRWVEVANAFWTEEYARDLFSFATPGEAHRPAGRGPHMNMDACFAESFVKVVSAKVNKDSYLPYLRQYGPGYLVVSIQHPWFDDQTIRRMKEFWKLGRPWPDRGCFKDVFIAHASLGRRSFRRWKT
jgi:hypothetical protein